METIQKRLDGAKAEEAAVCLGIPVRNPPHTASHKGDGKKRKRSARCRTTPTTDDGPQGMNSHERRVLYVRSIHSILNFSARTCHSLTRSSDSISKSLSREVGWKWEKERRELAA